MGGWLSTETKRVAAAAVAATWLRSGASHCWSSRARPARPWAFADAARGARAPPRRVLGPLRRTAWRAGAPARRSSRHSAAGRARTSFDPIYNEGRARATFRLSDSDCQQIPHFLVSKFTSEQPARFYRESDLLQHVAQHARLPLRRRSERRRPSAADGAATTPRKPRQDRGGGVQQPRRRAAPRWSSHDTSTARQAAAESVQRARRR